MNFNNHFDLEGQHALLGASKYHWINYSEDKLIDYYISSQAVERGNKLHETAKMLIEQNIRLPKTKKTFNMYVNDAIGFRMIPEQVLYYSQYCFGTADSICFRNDVLRIHDLKTGETPAHMEQLYIYAAYFCLEYNVQPKDINIELRIYQNDEILIDNPGVEKICPIIDKAVLFTKILSKYESKETDR